MKESIANARSLDSSMVGLETAAAGSVMMGTHIVMGQSLLMDDLSPSCLESHYINDM